MGSSQTGSKQQSILSSLPFAVGLMVVLVLFMLAGVIPVQGDKPTVIFYTPVFGGLLTLLTVSLLLCSATRRLRVRALGFHLSHLGVAVLLLGAFIGTLREQKFTMRIFADESRPPQIQQLGRSRIKHPDFSLKLKSFEVAYYNPDLVLYKGYKPEAKLRLTPNEILDLGTFGKYQVKDITHNTRITNYELDGQPELVIYEKGQEWQRIPVGEDHDEVRLPNGSRLRIAKVYNNLPSMQIGENFQETDFPVRPGLIVRIEDDIQTSILSLAAGQRPVVMTHGGGDIPQLFYDFPPIANIEVGPAYHGSGQTSVRLMSEDGAEIVLILGSFLSEACLLDDEHTLRLLPPVVQQYRADLELLDADGQSQRKQLSVNHPIDHAGWRLYLESYDMEHMEFIMITVRKDPGVKLALAGMYSIMLGVALTFYTKKRKAD